MFLILQPEFYKYSAPHVPLLNHLQIAIPLSFLQNKSNFFFKKFRLIWKLGENKLVIPLKSAT